MSTRRTAKVACQPDWCPVERTLAIIGGVWKVIIIRELLTGTRRYSQLHRALRGVTHKMLTQQLRELEQDGVVHRETYPQVPPKVEYSLTALGRGLDPLLHEMRRWGNRIPEPVAEHQPGLPPSGRMRPSASRRRFPAPPPRDPTPSPAP